MLRWIGIVALLMTQVTECQKRSTATASGQPGVVGTWLLLEEAKSGPDDRLQRSPVSALPRQTLTLTEAGRVAVEGERLAHLRAYTAYRVDSTRAFMDYQNRLVFLPEPTDADPLANFIQRDGDTLRLIRPGRGASRSTFVRVN